MNTITFRPGDSAVWTFAPEDGSGQPVDLTGASAWVEIDAGTACARLPLLRAEQGFDWLMNDETMPELLPDFYRATFRIQWPDGLNDRADFVLKFEKGCA